MVRGLLVNIPVAMTMPSVTQHCGRLKKAKPSAGSMLLYLFLFLFMYFSAHTVTKLF